jgi:hypothetical protein
MAKDWLNLFLSLGALMLLIFGVPYGSWWLYGKWRRWRRRRVVRARLDRALMQDRLAAGRWV